MIINNLYRHAFILFCNLNLCSCAFVSCNYSISSIIRKIINYTGSSNRKIAYCTHALVIESVGLLTTYCVTVSTFIPMIIVIYGISSIIVMLELFNYISFYYFITEGTSHCIIAFTGTCRIGSYSFPYVLAIVW